MCKTLLMGTGRAVFAAAMCVSLVPVASADMGGQLPDLAAGGLPLAYEVTDLGSLAGGNSIAYAVNDLGHVVGQSDGRAFLWTPTSGMVELDTSDWTGSSARDINDQGQVVGWLSQTVYRPVLWDGTSRTILLEEWSGAAAINNLGKIVGGFGLWDAGVVTPIPEFSPQDISDSGTVVGYDEGSGLCRAYMWREGVATLLAAPAGYPKPKALCINSLGDIVGYSLDSSSSKHAACAWREGTVEVFPAPDGYQSAAAGINDAGLIVGMSTFPNMPGGVKAMAIEDGLITRLLPLIDPNPGWTHIRVTDVNSKGQIVGEGTMGHTCHAVLLTPVPEPATLALLSVGGLALIRRRGHGG